MMALSLWQPYASLIAVGVKHYETRHWYSGHRGPIAIHAAKRVNKREEIEILDMIRDEALDDGDVENAEKITTLIENHSAIPRGAVVATGQLGEILRMVRPGHVVAGPMISNGQISLTERACGDWSAGRYAWHIDDVQALAEPVPFKGRQGLFWIPASELEGAAP